MNRGGSGRLLRTLILPLVLISAAVVVLSWPRAIPSGSDPAGTTPEGAALRVQIEPDETSAPDARDELATQIRAMRGTGPDEPVFHYHADGSVSADLGRRFLKMSVATVDENGRVQTSCVDAGEVETPTGGER